jgi:hypothetical protein
MNQDNYQTEELLEESIRAANRTTSAVRAIAILFLYLVPFELAAGVILGLSYTGMFTARDNPVAAAILILVIGAIFTVVAAYRELLNSKVVAGPNSRVFEAREVAQNISFSSDE